MVGAARLTAHRSRGGADAGGGRPGRLACCAARCTRPARRFRGVVGVASLPRLLGRPAGDLPGRVDDGRHTHQYCCAYIEMSRWLLVHRRSSDRWARCRKALGWSRSGLSTVAAGPAIGRAYSTGRITLNELNMSAVWVDVNRVTIVSSVLKIVCSACLASGDWSPRCRLS
jgi:hypothetical protein